MSPSLSRYLDRQSGQIKEDRLYAPGFLGWAYGTGPGWRLTNLLFSRRLISRVYGWIHKTRWSRRKIAPFAREMGVDPTECLRPLDAFASFNDFIVREIDLSRRPFVQDPAVCAAPVDGRLLAYQDIRADRPLPIKHAPLDPETLLQDRALARAYAGGSVVVSRLYLADYHHFHFPVEGVPQAARSIPGRYFAVTPYSARRPVPVFADNHRMVTRIETDRFGPIVMVEVGSFTIGSIQQRYRPGRPVRRGDHKGFFELGGSVVVLFFEQGAIRLDDDLCANTAKGMETYVRLGESIGRL
ncbi:MAG: phosphatidylserine decarboxylase [Alphaproteobacteria bacterium]|nr:phosphatidylserine decarboxylase [Alphaproteobacteria bacterium]